MYCGSCLHDNTLAAALIQQGHDVVLVPIYTPIRTDEEDVSLPRVFFGGINAYLQQKFPLFRRTPRWIDDWLDHPVLMRFLAGRGASVDPARLGDMTVSMLRGETGNQAKELTKLVDWLLDEVQPDVVHLSNSMMLGLAGIISEKCGPPVVCTLSGEDVFLEKLVAPHYQQARELLVQRAARVDAFVALNEYYADFMADYLEVDRPRIAVIRHGLLLDGHGSRQPRPDDQPRRIGFLARICEDKGLHLFVEAGQRLVERTDLPPFELHAAGYLGTGDRKYFRRLKKQIAAGPLAERFFYHGELSRLEKIAFLQSLEVFSTPTVYQESKGLPTLEALANGVPVVLPNHGTFPELVTKTGGGLLFEPHDVDHLADCLAQLLLDREKGKHLGRRGQRAIQEHFNAEKMANDTMALYETLLTRQQQPPKNVAP